MQKKKALDLSQGKVWKVLITFILPILAGSLIQQLYTTVDAVVVGQYVGKEGLAAVSSMYTTFKFPLNFLSGLSAGATIVISGLFGSQNHKDLDSAVRTGFTFAVVLGVMFSIIGAVITPALLKIMSVPADIAHDTLVYCRIFFGGLWTMTLYNMLAGMLRAFGNSKSPFYILLVCCAVNIVGDLLLVGVLHTGVAGAAIATVLAQFVSVILAMRELSKTHKCEDGSLWRLTFEKNHIRHMLVVGMPLALQSILFPVANSIVANSVNKMGTDIIAAWSVDGKLDMFIWLVADSMAPALSTYVSQNMGAGRRDRVLQGTLIGAAFSVGTVLLISLALYLFPGPLSALFVTAADRAVVCPMAVHFMRMMAPFYFFYAIAEAFSGSCCGLGDTVSPMIVTLICTCGLRVFSIFVILPHFGSMECIVWIYIASWIATGLAFLSMFTWKIRHINTAPQTPAQVS